MSKIPIFNEKDLNALIEQALKGNGVLVAPQEISQMIINLHGVSISSKPRKDGRYQGYIIDENGRTYAYGRTREEVAVKLKDFLRYGTPKKKKVDNVNNVPTTFTAFAMYYFENFRKRKVTALTYKKDLQRFNKHLAPYFAETQLKKITPLSCQSLLENLTEQGKGKTADEIYCLMSVIFKSAIKHGILVRNPLDVIYHETHERKSGTALTREEERKLKTELTGTPFLNVCMLALYTGLRPNELSTARVDGAFIVSVNSKRKGKRIEYKKIPIIKALKPYLKDGISKMPRAETFRIAYKSVLPNHIIYDMRTTFYTRCKEYGVSEHALSAFMGHSLGALGNAYTDLPDEYLLKEAKKLEFWE